MDKGLVMPHRRFVYDGEMLTDSVNFAVPQQQQKDTCDLHEVYVYLFNDIIVLAKRPRIATIMGTMGKAIGRDEPLRFAEKLDLSRTVVTLVCPLILLLVFLPVCYAVAKYRSGFVWFRFANEKSSTRLFLCQKRKFQTTLGWFNQRKY